MYLRKTQILKLTFNSWFKDIHIIGQRKALFREKILVQQYPEHFFIVLFLKFL